MAFRVYHDTKCTICTGPLYLYSGTDPNTSTVKHTVGCHICGKVYLIDDNIVYAYDMLDMHRSTVVPLTEEPKVVEPALPKYIVNEKGEQVLATRDVIYKLNKTRLVCVNCGKNTHERPIYMTIIRYCNCVDKM